MTQDLITYVIVTVAVAYTIYSFVKMLIQKNDSTSCGSGSCGCNKDELLKNIKSGKVKPVRVA